MVNLEKLPNEQDQHHGLAHCQAFICIRESWKVTKWIQLVKQVYISLLVGQHCHMVGLLGDSNFGNLRMDYEVFTLLRILCIAYV